MNASQLIKKVIKQEQLKIVIDRSGIIEEVQAELWNIEIKKMVQVDYGHYLPYNEDSKDLGNVEFCWVIKE